MKLSEAQRQVLDYLSHRKEYDGPPTGPEISIDCGRAPYWASGKIASLEKRGLVERLGTSLTGGNCYCITTAGRQALADSKGGET
jgi:DNA-binding MarR family transcriptional regulator